MTFRLTTQVPDGRKTSRHRARTGIVVYLVGLRRARRTSLYRFSRLLMGHSGGKDPCRILNWGTAVFACQVAGKLIAQVAVKLIRPSLLADWNDSI